MAIEVGGTLFSLPPAALARDPDSTLSALLLPALAAPPRIARSAELFHHVAAFLDSNALPEDVGLLRDLYVESAFYRLATLRDAIEATLLRGGGGGAPPSPFPSAGERHASTLAAATSALERASAALRSPPRGAPASPSSASPRSPVSLRRSPERAVGISTAAYVTGAWRRMYSVAGAADGGSTSAPVSAAETRGHRTGGGAAATAAPFVSPTKASHDALSRAAEATMLPDPFGFSRKRGSALVDAGRGGTSSSSLFDSITALDAGGESSSARGCAGTMHVLGTLLSQRLALREEEGGHPVGGDGARVSRASQAVAVTSQAVALTDAAPPPVDVGALLAALLERLPPLAPPPTTKGEQPPQVSQGVGGAGAAAAAPAVDAVLNDEQHGERRPCTASWAPLSLLCLALATTLSLLTRYRYAGAALSLVSRSPLQHPGRDAGGRHRVASGGAASAAAAAVGSLPRSLPPSTSAASSAAPKLVIAFYLPQPDYSDVQADAPRWAGGPPLPRPLTGYHNLLDVNVRQLNGRLAREYGVGGFAYLYHRWRRPVGGTSAEAPLEALLEDGEPDVPFMLAWAGEGWVYDHASGEGGALDDPFAEADWRPHFEWLLRFFRHHHYILRDGRPVLLLTRPAGEVEDAFDSMLSAWRSWAVEAGYPDGLFVIQMSGHRHVPSAVLKSPAFDGVMELSPDFFTAAGGSSADHLGAAASAHPEDAGVDPRDHFFGVHTSVHADEAVLPYHPVSLQFALKQHLWRSPPGAFVFVSAWNAWGGGAAIEPSIESGYAWLRAVKAAVDDDAAGVPPLHIPPAGVPSSPPVLGRDQRVCILVRTYRAHATGLYSLQRSLQTLQALQHTNFVAFVFDSNPDGFPELGGIVDSLRDSRFVTVDTPAAQRVRYDPVSSAYSTVDAMLVEKCLSPSSAPPFDWLLVTNGDNFYAPDALNHLPDDTDLVLMNFHGRYSLSNAYVYMGADPAQCCTRLRSYTCTPAMPMVGSVDLGAMLIRAPSWTAAHLNFSRFTGACPASCHDGAFAEHVDRVLGWRLAHHPTSACALMHNPNPVSCALVGGLYYDAIDWRDAGCYDAAALPLALRDVDWGKFYSLSDGCVCEHQRAPVHKYLTALSRYVFK